jgi:hypothetical protein
MKVEYKQVTVQHRWGNLSAPGIECNVLTVSTQGRGTPMSSRNGLSEMSTTVLSRRDGLFSITGTSSFSYSSSSGTVTNTGAKVTFFTGR